jgi:hypothetical protein
MESAGSIADCSTETYDQSAGADRRDAKLRQSQGGGEGEKA